MLYNIWLVDVEQRHHHVGFIAIAVLHLPRLNSDNPTSFDATGNISAKSHPHFNGYIIERRLAAASPLPGLPWLEFI